MIVETTQKTIERSHQFEETSFKLEINENIFNILRNQIYTDKIGAVCREYMCNARDAHLLNGNSSKPIDVYAPSLENLEFRVRDYGTGLSKEDIFEIYVSYSKSLKRDDKNAIGYFGIGAKSGFAYSPSFQVVSYFKGEKYIYNAYSSEDGVGKMALLVKEPCSEESGMEIIIPVNISDIKTFSEKIANVGQFWDVKPNVYGIKDFKFNELEYNLESNGKWAFPKFSSYTSRRSKVIMGGIQYLIDPQLITNATSLQQKMLTKGVYIFANLGEVNIPPSRETVEYTPKTIAFIKEKLKQIELEIKERINKRLESINTEWEARLFYHEIFNESGDLNIFKDIVKDSVKIKYKNVEIDSMAIKIPFSYFYAELYRDRQYKLRTRAGLNISSEFGNSIDLISSYLKQSNKNGIHRLFYTLKVKGVGKIRKIFRHYLETQNTIDSQCFCFRLTQPNDLENFKQFCIEKGIDFNLFKNADDIPLPVQAKVFKKTNGETTLTGYNAHIYDPSNFFDDDEIGENIMGKERALETCLFNVDFDSAESGYYVLRSGTEYETFGYNFDYLYKKINKLDPEFSKHPVIYAFTERSVPKLNKNGWINIATHLSNILDKKYKDINIDTLYISELYFDYTIRDRICEIINFKINCEAVKKMQSLVCINPQYCSLAKNDYDLYKKIKSNEDVDKIESIKNLRKKEIEDLLKIFLDSYPVLHYVSPCNWSTNTIQNYINSVINTKN